jgi:hypothetical protein
MRGLLHLVAAALVAGQSRASTPDWTTVDTDQLKDRLVDSENLLVACELVNEAEPPWQPLTCPSRRGEYTRCSCLVLKTKIAEC